MGEVVDAFVLGEQAADGSVRGDDRIECGVSDAAQMCFELCKCQLDGIENGTVGRQRQQPKTLRLESFSSSWASMNGQVVENDHGSRGSVMHRTGGELLSCSAVPREPAGAGGLMALY